jgi:spore maturation protein CgeB
MKIVFCGLSVTSSWGNGHAVTFRGLMKALALRGHDVLFLERDVPYYAVQRDLPVPPYGSTRLYGSLEELTDRYTNEVREADLSVVGSFVPEGIAVGEWVLRNARGITAFYDIDTPITLTRLAREDCFYLSAGQVPRYGLLLSFTGGPTLDRLRVELGARAPRPFYCSVDPEVHRPLDARRPWALGYMGTYSADRQPVLDRLLAEPARARPGDRMVVAGPQYPPGLDWPENVDRIDHLPPADHPQFYASQKFTLNVTRGDMLRAGYSPSIRLFEAAGCGVPVISDAWPGVETFFTPGAEILLARTGADVERFLDGVGEDESRRIGERARRRVLAEHTSARRAEQLERYVDEARSS